MKTFAIVKPLSTLNLIESHFSPRNERCLLYKQKGQVQRDGMDSNKKSNPFPPDKIHSFRCVSERKNKNKNKHKQMIYSKSSISSSVISNFKCIQRDHLS